MAKITEFVEHGNPDDLLWKSDNSRQCATCSEKKVLAQFYFKPSSGQVSLDCRQCIDNRKAANAVQKEAAGTDLLASALAKATGRRTLLDAVPNYSDLVTKVVDKLGGLDRVASLVTRAAKKALRSNKPDIGRKAATLLLDMVLQSNKQAGPPIDISEITMEDRMMILIEPAKQLLLESAEFRQELLADPEIRDKLLGDSGKTLIDVTGEKPEEQTEA